jgi:hypothetical protein
MCDFGHPPCASVDRATFLHNHKRAWRTRPHRRHSKRQATPAWSPTARRRARHAMSGGVMLISRTLLVCSVAFTLSACGDDGADGESAQVTEIRAGKGSDCPNGGLRVSVGDDEHVVCSGANGSDGRDGADGQDGADGKDGAPGPMGAMGAMGAVGAPGRDGAEGAAGAAWTPDSITACGAIVTLPSSAVSARLAYTLVRFSDGSVIASCTAQTNGLVSADATHVYAGWQVGSVAGHCSLGSDASGTANSGWWEFEVVSGKPRARYHDVGTADDLATYTFLTSDCPTAMR